jgi:hypothetical protein
VRRVYLKVSTDAPTLVISQPCRIGPGDKTRVSHSFRRAVIAVDEVPDNVAMAEVVLRANQTVWIAPWNGPYVIAYSSLGVGKIVR